MNKLAQTSAPTVTLFASLLIAVSPYSMSATTLKYCSEGSPAFLDPGQSSSVTDYDVQTPMFDALIDIERGTLNRIPGLATRWDVSADNLTYTFFLRPGVKFHTTPWFKPSRDFNADDVVFTDKRLTDRNMPFRKAYPTESPFVADEGLDKLLASVEKIDALTVRFKLNEVSATFFDNLANTQYSIHSAQYAEQLLKAGTPHLINTQPVGTGPFIFKSYQKDSTVRFARNPDFWRPEVTRIDNLIFAITTDRNVRAQKLRAGECDVSALASATEIAELRKDPNIQVLSKPGNNIGFLSYNFKKPPLDKLEVRQALDMGMDKQRIVDAVFQGAGQVANAGLPLPNWAHDTKRVPVAYQPDKARELLKKAGVNGLAITLWALPVQRAYNPNGRLMAEMIQSDWAKIGVKATIVTYEWGEYLKRARAHEHDTALLGWNADLDPDGTLAAWTCGAGNNRSAWCNPAFDELIAKGRKTVGRPQRIPIYLQAQKIMAEQLPVSPIAYGATLVPLRKNVVDFKIGGGAEMRFDGVSIQ